MPMPRKLLVPILLLLGAAGIHAHSPPRAGKSLPNIVFILADDAGWADPGRYHQLATGTPPAVPTPHLDRLADQGMLFTDAHLQHALCAPNRFTLMTGSYTQRSRPWGTWNRTASSAFHYGAATDDRLANPHRTIGSALQQAGYRTAYFGKMHFGGDFFDTSGNLLRDLPNDQLHQIDFTRRFRNGLLDHGFDTTFVCPDGIQGPLYAWFENDRYRPVSDFAADIPGLAPGPPSTLRAFSAGEKGGDGEMIIAGFGDSRFDTSEHGRILNHFIDRFIEDHLTNHRGKPFFTFLATPAIHVPLTPDRDVAGTSGLDLRADFVIDLDNQIGRVLQTLDRLGIANNTLVIFTSDNGGALSGGNAMIAAGQNPNAHLRGNKGSIYEGGHRVPFLWKWGDGTAAGSVIPPGTVCNHLVSALDWVPSIIDLVGGTVAPDQHMDSTSLLPLLFSENPDARPPVRSHHLHVTDLEPARTAVRMNDAGGKWVLIRSTGSLPMELYNLATDPSQSVNLVEGFATPADLPAGHPQRERALAMNTYYNNHPNSNPGTNAPRTQAAANFDPAPLIFHNALQDPGFETFPASSSYPDAATSPWRILNQQDDNFGTQILANNGTNPRTGNNLFSFHYYYLSNDTLAQEIPFPIDASQTHRLAFWAALGQASASSAHINPPSLLLQIQTATSPGGSYSLLKQAANLLPAGGTWTEFSLSLSPAELAPHHGRYFRVLLKKSNANTTHRIAIDDFSLTRQTPFGSSTDKTPVPVPVAPPLAAIFRHHEGFSVVFDPIEPDTTWQVEEADSPAGPWSPGENSTGTSPWSIPRPATANRKFFRAKGPSHIERFVLPLN